MTSRMTRSAHGLSAADDALGWHRRGLCRLPEHDCEWWITYGPPTRENARAVRICGECPVRIQCRDDMLATDGPWRPRSVIAGGWRFRDKKPPVPYPGDEHLAEAS